MKQRCRRTARAPVPRGASWLACIALAGLIVAASSSWACVPQPLLSILPRSSGEPGSQVTLQGIHFSGRVEVRWNTVDGPLLATATQSPFSVTATIPQSSPPGLYALVAFERDPAGGIVGVTRSAFEITSVSTPTPTAPTPGRTSPTNTLASERTSPSTAFIAGLGATAGIVLLVTGGFWGASLTRRRKTPP